MYFVKKIKTKHIYRIILEQKNYIFSNSYRKMRTIITNALLNSNELLFLSVLTYLAGGKVCIYIIAMSYYFCQF
jgi:hypothetical protein